MEMINRFILSMVDTVRCRYPPLFIVAKNKSQRPNEKSKMKIKTAVLLELIGFG
jgi:hypothetical protein